MHPEDERYQHLIGKQVILPLVGRRIPIIADEYADPELGSGAVKITPAHDFNDFEVGQRHGLKPINIFTTTAKLNNNVPAAYRGLDRFEARKKVLDDLEAMGVLAWVDDKKIMVPYDEKTKLVVIEPFLTDQWFVNAEVLAEPALASVREGRTKFVPKQLREHLFRLDGEHQAVVHFAPALVGPSDPGLVRPAAQHRPRFQQRRRRPEGLRRRHRGRGRSSRPRPITAARSRCSPAGSTRPTTSRPITASTRPSATG